jgi:FeS assembly protein IscX
MEEMLSWEDTYAIALELIARYPEKNLESVSLEMIYDWTISLPRFSDDPELANDAILLAIFQEWYEEINPL